MNKTCYKCDVTKPVTDFAKRGGSRTYRNMCRDCWNAYYRVFNTSEEQRKKSTQKMREWRARPGNKERVESRRQERNKLAPKAVFRAAVHNARMRAETLVTNEDLMKLWEAQDGKCALTGIVMTWGTGWIESTSISLDRIDQGGKYEHGNVRLICHCINTFRGRMNDDDMYAMAMALIANMKRPKLRLVG